MSEGQREREKERERWIHRDSGRNKDEGIGVGGWTIRRDHPMKPSAVRGIVDTYPYHTLSAKGRSFIGIKAISGRECEEERSVLLLVAA